MAINQTPLSRAVQIAGSQHKLADAIGFSQHAVWHALRRGRVSAEMARAIEKATGVAAADLRPDLFGA